MDAFFFRNRLSALVDGELSPREAREMREAMARDPALAAELDALGRLLERLHEEGPVTPPPGLSIKLSSVAGSGASWRAFVVPGVGAALLVAWVSGVSPGAGGAAMEGGGSVATVGGRGGDGAGVGGTGDGADGADDGADGLGDGVGGGGDGDDDGSGEGVGGSGDGAGGTGDGAGGTGDGTGDGSGGTGDGGEGSASGIDGDGVGGEGRAGEVDGVGGVENGAANIRDGLAEGDGTGASDEGPGEKASGGGTNGTAGLPDRSAALEDARRQRASGKSSGSRGGVEREMYLAPFERMEIAETPVDESSRFRYRILANNDMVLTSLKAVATSVGGELLKSRGAPLATYPLDPGDRLEVQVLLPSENLSALVGQLPSLGAVTPLSTPAAVPAGRVSVFVVLEVP